MECTSGLCPIHRYSGVNAAEEIGRGEKYRYKKRAHVLDIVWFGNDFGRYIWNAGQIGAGESLLQDGFVNGHLQTIYAYVAQSYHGSFLTAFKGEPYWFIQVTRQLDLDMD